MRGNDRRHAGDDAERVCLRGVGGERVGICCRGGCSVESLRSLDLAVSDLCHRLNSHGRLGGGEGEEKGAEEDGGTHGCGFCGG